MGFEVDFLAVGNGDKSGDAIALRYGNLYGDRSEYKVIVIDGGFTESGKNLVQHIKEVYRTNFVDLVVSTHPDNDHICGLFVVLEELRVGQLWMHRPQGHSTRVHQLVESVRSRNTIANRIEESLKQSADLEDIAIRKGIPIFEPFVGVGTTDGCFVVLGPTKEYYQHLLCEIVEEKSLATHLFEMARHGMSELLARVMETWEIEKLLDPPDNCVSAINNSSALTLLRVDGAMMFFTSDAGVPALTQAAMVAEHNRIDLRNCRFQQVPHHGSRRNVGPTLLNRIIGFPQPNNTPSRLTAFCSSAMESQKHPRPKVRNAYVRRGATFLSTRGKNIWHYENAPARNNYSPATGEPFSYSYEED